MPLVIILFMHQIVLDNYNVILQQIIEFIQTELNLKARFLNLYQKLFCFELVKSDSICFSFKIV